MSLPDLSHLFVFRASCQTKVPLLSCHPFPVEAGYGLNECPVKHSSMMNCFPCWVFLFSYFFFFVFTTRSLNCLDRGAHRSHQPFRCLLSVMSQNRVKANRDRNGVPSHFVLGWGGWDFPSFRSVSSLNASDVAWCTPAYFALATSYSIVDAHFILV